MVVSNLEISGIWAWIVFASIIKYLHVVSSNESKAGIRQFILHVGSSIIVAYLFMTGVNTLENGIIYEVPAALIGSLLGRTLIDYMNAENINHILEKILNVKKK